MKRQLLSLAAIAALALGASILPPAAWSQSQVPSVEKMGPDSATTYLFDDIGIKAYLMCSPGALGAGIGTSVSIDFSTATLDLAKVPDALAKKYKSAGTAKVIRLRIFQTMGESRREVLESVGRPLVLYIRAGSVDATKDNEINDLFVTAAIQAGGGKGDEDRGWLRVKDILESKAAGDFVLGNCARTPDKRYYRIELKEWPKGEMFVDGG
jgi:hypothetical protein